MFQLAGTNVTNLSHDSRSAMPNRFMDGVGLSQVAPRLVALANLKHEPNWSSLLMVALAKDKVRLHQT